MEIAAINKASLMALILTVAVLRCTEAQYISETYALAGESYTADCHTTVYLLPGKSVRINAWSSSRQDLSGYGYRDCPIYFETAHEDPGNPKFTFNFDYSKSNYMNTEHGLCLTTLKIYDSASTTSSYKYRYDCFSTLPEYTTNQVNSEFFTVEFSRTDLDFNDFDFSIIVTIEYQDTEIFIFSWWWVGLPLILVVGLISSIIGCCVRYQSQQRLAQSRRANATTTVAYSASTGDVSYPTGSQPYVTAQPPPYSEVKSTAYQPYPTQAYPTGQNTAPA